MASYTITKTNGDTLVSIPDTELNTDYGISLIGRNYSGYGVFLNDNFVGLLENFASNNPPAQPLAGQLWFEADTGHLQLWQGNTWKRLGHTSTSATAPTSSGRVVGDTWWDTGNLQLKVWSGQITSNVAAIYTTAGDIISLTSSDDVRVGDLITSPTISESSNLTVAQILNSTNVRVTSTATVASGQTITVTRGAGWYLVGPSYTKDQQLTGVFPKDIIDTRGITHTVGLMYQRGQIVGAVSHDNEFTPRTADAIDRLPVIKPGLTLIEDTAPQLVRTVLANTVGSSGNTVISISSTTDLQLGDFIITNDVPYSSLATLTEIFANNSIRISTATTIYSGDTIVFQRGSNQANLFNGTATNAQRLNGVTADRFAVLEDSQLFQQDLAVKGNLTIGGTNGVSTTFWQQATNLSIINSELNGNIDLFSVVDSLGSNSILLTVNAIVTNGSDPSLITVTSAGHGLSVNDIFTVRNVNPLIDNADRAEGTFIVNSVLSSSQFTYLARGQVGTSVASLANLELQIRKGSIYTRVFHASGINGLIEVVGDPTSSKGVATKNYVDNKHQDALTALSANVATLVGGAGVSRRDFGNVSLALDGLTSDVSSINVTLGTKANTDSPALAGTPTAPTATAGTATTQIATTAFVTTAFTSLSDSTSANASAQASELALKAPIASPDFTGNPQVPTVEDNDRSRRIATTYFVANVVGQGISTFGTELAARAYAADSVLTGTPVAPTAANLTYTIPAGYTSSAAIPVSGGTTQIATTAFVANAIARIPAANLAPYATRVDTLLEGVPQSTTAPMGTANAWIATTRFVAEYSPVLKVANKTGNVSLSVEDVSGAAPIASPDFTGTPTADTAPPESNTRTLATTEFVKRITSNLASQTNPTFIGTVTLPSLVQSDNSAAAVSSGWVRTFVANADVPKWGGRRNYVSTVAPTSSDGNPGDIWFQIAP